MPMIDPLLAEFEQEAATTRRVLERVPEDKLSWRPHPKSFSLGQLALHIAAGPKSIASAAAADSLEYNFPSAPEAKSREELLDTFSDAVSCAVATLKPLTDEQLQANWTLTSKGQTVMSVPRAAFLRMVLLNHIYHHRGQLSVYLRLCNVAVPSIYGPSADESPFERSATA